MQRPLLFAALVALASTAAVPRALILRTPMTTPDASCTAGYQGIEDSSFVGNGSAFSLSPPTGDLQVKTAWTTPHGLASDTGNPASFAFKVLSGNGTFTLYQDVCLTTGDGQIHNSSFNIGVTSPVAGADSTSGCKVVFQLNGHSTAREVPVCELPTAANPFGVCNLPSVDPATKYVQHSLIFTVRTPVNRVGILFDCTAAPNQAQVVVDKWTVLPSRAASS